MRPCRALAHVECAGNVRHCYRPSVQKKVIDATYPSPDCWQVQPHSGRDFSWHGGPRSALRSGAIAHDDPNNGAQPVQESLHHPSTCTRVSGVRVELHEHLVSCARDVLTPKPVDGDPEEATGACDSEFISFKDEFHGQTLRPRRQIAMHECVRHQLTKRLHRECVFIPDGAVRVRHDARRNIYLKPFHGITQHGGNRSVDEFRVDGPLVVCGRQSTRHVQGEARVSSP